MAKDVILESIRMVEEVDQYPDLSWLETELDEAGNIVSSCRYTQADLRKYGRKKVMAWIKEDRERLTSYGTIWWMVGIYAEAKLLVKGVVQTIRSGGLWGIESDSDPSYKQEVARDELSLLRDLLTTLAVDGSSFDSLASAVTLQG